MIVAWEQPICTAQLDKINYRIASKYLVHTMDNIFYTFLMPRVLKYPTKQMISVWLYRLLQCQILKHQLLFVGSSQYSEIYLK